MNQAKTISRQSQWEGFGVLAHMQRFFLTINRFLRYGSVILALALAFLQPIGTLAAEETVKIIPNLQAPDQPANLLQLTADNIKPVGVGGAVNTNQFVAASTIRDPDPEDTLVIEIEIRPLGIQFVNQPNYASPTIKTVGVPMVVPLLISGLFEGQYHWQERIRDQAGHMTPWVSFGTNNETSADIIVDQTVPAPPSNVTATGGLASATIHWTPSPSDDAMQVDVLRGLTVETVDEVIAQVSASQTSYTDVNLKEGTIYWYSLRAKDKAGNISGLTVPSSAITDVIVDDSMVGKVVFSGVWGEVANLDSSIAYNGTFRWAPGDSGSTVTYQPLVPTAGQYEVLVSWVVNPPNFIGKQATNAPYIISDVQGDQMKFVDQSKLADGTSATSSAWSGWHSLGIYTTDDQKSLSVTLLGKANGYVTTDASRFVAIRPLPPTDLVLTTEVHGGKDVVKLHWANSPSRSINRYRIYRTLSPGAYDLTKPVAEVARGEFIDTTAQTAQTYWYAVTAFDGTRESIRSVEAQISLVDTIAPARPNELNISDGDGLLALSWPKVPDAAMYEITVKRVDTNRVVASMILTGDQTSTKIVSLVNGQIYSVDLVALDAQGNRSPFIGVTGQPKSPVPTPLPQAAEKPVATKETTRPAAKPATQAAPSVKDAKEPKAPEPVVEVEPRPQEPEGDVKGAQDQRPDQNRLLVTVLILAIAIVVGVGGYYGYDWWFSKTEEISPYESPIERKDAQPTLPPSEQKPPKKDTDEARGKW